MEILNRRSKQPEEMIQEQPHEDSNNDLVPSQVRRRLVRVLAMDKLIEGLPHQTTIERHQTEIIPQSQHTSKSILDWLCCCFNYQRSHKPKTLKIRTDKGLRTLIQRKRTEKVKTVLKDNSKKKTLVLDLDETLVHSSYELQSWDFKTQFQHEGKTKYAFTKKRPGLDSFLHVMSNYYELIAFTAGIPDLSAKILDKIDPDRVIKHRIFRQHCIQVDYSNKIYLKNLNILNRNMKDVILLDNSSNSGLMHPQNMLLIGSFYHDEEDHELQRLTPFLIYLSSMDDVRNVEQRRTQYYKNDKQYDKNVRERSRSRTVRMQLNIC